MKDGVVWMGGHLGNLSTIMAYIKSHYDHVVLISHLVELKDQADYSINIERRKEIVDGKEYEYSYVNNTATSKSGSSGSKSGSKTSGSKTAATKKSGSKSGHKNQ
jgi:hypothetical protein